LVACASPKICEIASATVATNDRVVASQLGVSSPYRFRVPIDLILSVLRINEIERESPIL